MFRIRLADGEEAVYRSVDELALGLSSGIITATAEYYHSASQEWLPIGSHPDFERAAARAGTLTATAQMEPEEPVPVPAAIVPTALPAERGSGPFQIYQMFSRSAAELQARRRPAWLLPAVTALGALLMVWSLAIALRSESPGSQTAGAAPAAVPSLAGRSRSGARSATAVPEEMAAIGLAPVNLAAHRSRVIAAADQSIADSADHLGLRGALSVSRLQSPDSVQLTQQALAVLRQLVASHRATQRRTDSAYRDSASNLVGSGIWSRIDQQEWRLRATPLESDRDALRADALLAALEGLFGLLAGQAGNYEFARGGVRFFQPAAGLEYDRLRAAILRQAQAGPGAWDSESPLMALLVAGIEENALPLRRQP